MRVYGFLLWVCLVGFGISLKPLKMPRDAFRRRLGTTSYSLQVCKEKEGEKSFQSFHPSGWFIIIHTNEQGEPSVCVLGGRQGSFPLRAGQVAVCKPHASKKNFASSAAAG